MEQDDHFSSSSDHHNSYTKEKKTDNERETKFKFIPSSLNRKRHKDYEPRKALEGKKFPSFVLPGQSVQQTKEQPKDDNATIDPTKKINEITKKNYYYEEEVDFDDLYDPASPNDYLLICREREEDAKEEMKRKELEEYYRLALEENHTVASEENEIDINTVEKNEMSGTISRNNLVHRNIDESSVDKGLLTNQPHRIERGRGRGVNNLPAWMLAEQKQKQKQEKL